MERFNTREEVEVIENEYFKEGVKARRNGEPLTACPYDYHSFPAGGWRGGWADEDMVLQSNRAA